MTDEPHKQTIREHIEAVAHQLLDAIERNIGKIGQGAPEAVAQYAQAVGSLSCWPNMNPLTTDDFRKLAEYEVAKAVEAARAAKAR
jgi:hypothetical protein